MALSWEQYVSVNCHNSCSEKLTCGVPQGYVLVPLLFVIYTNDISKASSKLPFFLFADHFESENLQQLQKVVNNKLKCIKEWT